MKDAINILDVVALTEDLPERGLYRGQVGTVVESLAPGVFEVEFSDDEGQAYAYACFGSRPATRAPLRAFGSRLIEPVLP